jgi:hypothetical protein
MRLISKLLSMVNGYKTQIFFGLSVILFGLGYFNIAIPEVAWQVLGFAFGASAVHKFQKIYQATKAEANPGPNISQQ